MIKLLASSNSLQGIEKAISEFFCEKKLLSQLSESEWVVLNNNGSSLKRTYRVILKKKRYRFECVQASEDKQEQKLSKPVLKLVENFNPSELLCQTKQDFGSHNLWWISPTGKQVDTEVALEAIRQALFVPCGDGLFEDEYSQTYKLAGAA